VYTQVPNELFDMIPELSGAAVKLLFILSRHTHGWHRADVTLSLTAMQSESGLSRSSVVRAIGELTAVGLVTVTRQSREENRYAIVPIRPALTVLSSPSPAPAPPTELTVRVLDADGGGVCSMCGLTATPLEMTRYGVCSFCYVKTSSKGAIMQ
jgi:hypothetical protein